MEVRRRFVSLNRRPEELVPIAAKDQDLLSRDDDDDAAEKWGDKLGLGGEDLDA
jgi:hypothetical protein